MVTGQDSQHVGMWAQSQVGATSVADKVYEPVVVDGGERDRRDNVARLAGPDDCARGHGIGPDIPGGHAHLRRRAAIRLPHRQRL